jgi:hypothetical protein
MLKPSGNLASWQAPFGGRVGRSHVLSAAQVSRLNFPLAKK